MPPTPNLGYSTTILSDLKLDAVDVAAQMEGLDWVGHYVVHGAGEGDETGVTIQMAYPATGII